MEIKVGEYVRTKDGYIAKFIHYGYNKGISGKSCLFDSAIRDISTYDYGGQDNFLWDRELKEYIVKHSKNIIDLIEVGDVVFYKTSNESEKVKVGIAEELPNVDLTSSLRVEFKALEELEIISFLTKEQFESIEYKVGD